jgi:hypothetical protein
MIFYILIIIIILILLFIPHCDKKKENKMFDIKRDVLSQTSELAKYLLLKN